MRNLRPAYDMIKEFEGLYLKAYLDPRPKNPIWTIGYGTIRYPNGQAVKSGDVITLNQAQEYLDREVDKFANDVNSLVKVSVNDNQFCALVSFAYNVGADIDSDDIAEGLGDSTLLKKLNAGDFFGASAEFPKWNKAEGKVLPGLVRRRAAEQKLFMTPIGSSTPDPIPKSEELPGWFAPFKIFIELLMEKIFGKSTSGVIPDTADIADRIIHSNPQINPTMIREAMKWKDNSKISNKNYIMLVDFNKNDSELRGYLISMASTHVEIMFKIAHGKNSDPNKDGMPTEFSDVSGSYKSSLGPVLIGKEFKNPKWKRVRLLYGLHPGVNGNIQKREILLHTTTYVNDVPGKSIGDTLGCFGVSEAVGEKIFPKVEGCLLFAWDDSYKG